MKYYLPLFFTFALFYILSCTADNSIQEIDPLAKYDFYTDTIGLDTPEEVAMQIIDFLDTRDTSKYLKVILPFEGQRYLAAQNLKYNPKIKDTIAHMQSLEERYDDRWINYFVRAGYILDIMKNDKGIQIDTSMIDTITFDEVRIKNYGGFEKYIVGEWADIDVKLNYNDEVYYFEIPQIIKLKDKWFLYYPEYYIRTESEFYWLKDRVKIINQNADEFWF